MITDGLSPITVLLFLGAVAASVVLVTLYIVARITKREPLARISARVISFEVPMKATGLRMILRNADPETPFMIGHENSLLHRKTTFRLPG